MPATKKTTDEPIGLEIGSKAPSLPLIRSDGETLTYNKISGSKGVAIAFVRSLDWCPFCKKQIRLLNEIREDLSALGWQAASLSYDSQADLIAFEQKNDIKIPLLSDPDSEVIDAFNLRNTRVKPGGRSVGVPHPAVVFIGGDGIVKAMLQINGYQKRPEPEDVLKTAASL